MKEIVFSSTTRLATAIRKRKITAQKALDAFLAQINKHNPAVNAVNIIGADQAKERAHTADEALARGELWGPLYFERRASDRWYAGHGRVSTLR
jgi:amidase